MFKIKYYVSIIILFVSFSGVSGQIIKTRLDFVGGISAREYLHGGIRYQYTDITQFGAYYGGDVGVYSEIISTWSLDHMIHFGKLGFYTNRPVWYARQGFTPISSQKSPDGPSHRCEARQGTETLAGSIGSPAGD